MPLMPFPEPFAELLSTIGVPADTLELVKENLQLRTQLRALIETLQSFSYAHHRSDHHTENFPKCANFVCLTLRLLLDESSID